MQGTLQASFIKFGLVVSKLSFEVIADDGRPLILKAHEHCMFTRYAAMVLQINILFKVTRVYRLNVTSPLYSMLNFSIIFQDFWIKTGLILLDLQNQKNNTAVSDFSLYFPALKVHECTK